MIRSNLESKFIQGIMEKISSIKLKCTRLFVAKHPVGVDTHAKAIEMLLDIESTDFRIVGVGPNNSWTRPICP